MGITSDSCKVLHEEAVGVWFVGRTGHHAGWNLRCRSQPDQLYGLIKVVLSLQ